MPTFKYRAYSGSGDLLEGEIEARTSEEAEDALFRRGLTPFETRETKPAGAGRLQFSFGKRGLNAAQIASFTREFATLEQADVPLDQSLRILAAQGATPALRDLAQEILARIVDGASLSDALTRRPDIFGPEFVNVVREGETVGKVGDSLNDIADMLERRLELHARIQSALIYPALLITLAIISTGVVLGTLVPSVAPIFADNGKEMPSGLQFILDIQANAGTIGLVLAGIFGAAIMAYKMAQTRPAWQIAIARFYLRIPVVGPMLAQFATARFSRTLGSMLNAGVPLLQGLESARIAVTNHFLNDALGGVIEAVRGGASLSGAIGRVPYIPPVATQMITIGEETAQLGDMLLRVAVMFERQTQRSIERAMGLLTPALTIFIAAVVGGLIMTVMDAVLSINDLAVK
ncbi:type II secretion system F family protein [Methylocystis parvus]|uniref:Type II secretion system F family protein n=1 Tax=Methylocystis parvus TaxID=134 RepID=A0A6B8M1B4_9HYPH|nr:type II secretion system F family protein [Methylocystis parvus]QGM96082.1 type II secretion system F family protein [Methylocystis parvus]WBK00094.1 type II secretion system F family protein [Methylocystis parvus OBBP]